MRPDIRARRWPVCSLRCRRHGLRATCTGVVLAWLLVFSPGSHEVGAQTFEGRSEKLSLEIRDWSQDRIPPTLHLYEPDPLEGFPVYVRGPLVKIRGKAEDRGSGWVNVRVNGVPPTTMQKGSFEVLVPVEQGTTYLRITVLDKNGNSTERLLTVIRDPAADLSPPLISLLEPVTQRGFKVLTEDSVLNVRGKVTDESGIWGVWVNWTQVDSLVEGQFDLRLRPAPDSLVIFVVDSFGNRAERQVTLLKDQQALDDSLFSGTYYALVIAVQNYADIELDDLSSPLRDADALVRTLVERYTFDLENIIVLRDPTRKQIFSAFEDVKEKLQPADHLLLFYAGHGEWRTDREQGFWLPSDATSRDISMWVSNADIRDNLKAIKARHILVVVDACFAGSMLSERGIGGGPSPHISSYLRYPSRTVLTSGELEPVPDESVFLKFLLTSLGDARERFVTGLDLYQMVRNNVIDNSPTRQVPRYGSIRETGGESMGDFVFIRR